MSWLKALLIPLIEWAGRLAVSWFKARAQRELTEEEKVFAQKQRVQQLTSIARIKERYAQKRAGLGAGNTSNTPVTSRSGMSKDSKGGQSPSGKTDV